MVSPRFLRGIERNLRYWQEQTATLDDAKIKQLHPQHANLRRAVDLGARFDETRVLSAELFDRTFLWIEQTRSERDWIRLAQKLSESNVTLHNPALHMRLMMRKGTLLRLLGRIDEAQKAHASVSEVAPPQLRAEIAFNISENYRVQHNLTKGIEAGKAALASARLGDNNTLLASILNTLGLLHLDMALYEPALTYLKEALTLERRLEKPTRLSRLYNNFGLLLQQTGKNNLALKNYELAAKVLHASNNYVDLAVALINKGAFHYSLNEIDLAEIAFIEAKDYLANTQGLYFYEALVATNLGKVAQARKQYPNASSYFMSAFDLAKLAGNEVYEANALGALAEVATAIGDWPLAQSNYRRAIKILHGHPQHAFAQTILAEFEEAVAAGSLSDPQPQAS